MKIRYRKFISAFIVSALIGCSFGSATATVEVKNTKIAVFSDPHYYAPELGTTGSAFEAYLAQDRKLLAESSAISAAAINELKKSDAKIILISGDLTKDGEKLSHQQFSKLLTSLENSGKKVYVVPGNHDINNPASSSYKGEKATFTDNISPDQFKNIYNNFGFSEAISSDKSSLSYVVEPMPGLTIIAMDSAQYVNNAKKTTPNDMIPLK